MMVISCVPRDRGSELGFLMKYAPVCCCKLGQNMTALQRYQKKGILIVFMFHSNYLNLSYYLQQADDYDTLATGITGTLNYIYWLGPNPGNNRLVGTGYESSDLTDDTQNILIDLTIKFRCRCIRVMTCHSIQPRAKHRHRNPEMTQEHYLGAVQVFCPHCLWNRDRNVVPVSMGGLRCMHNGWTNLLW